VARMNTATAASPPESWTSSSRAIDGCPGPALSRRPARFRGNATARSAGRESIPDARLRRPWPARGLPHRDCRGGAAAPSRQFRRSMPTAFGAEPIQPPPQTAEIAGGRQPNCDRGPVAVAARTPSTPSRGPDCPTTIILRKVTNIPMIVACLADQDQLDDARDFADFPVDPSDDAANITVG
jgi:hypothetical protein